MSQLRVAVVVPSYNRRALLADNIDSLLNQILPPPWELRVVVVDDGSTDDTVPWLCEKYGQKSDQKIDQKNKMSSSGGQAFLLSDRLILLRQKNGERGAARNFGASYAIQRENADWVLFLDSDDCMVRGGLKALLEKTDNVRVAVYGLIELWAPGKKGRPLRCAGYEGDVSLPMLRQNQLYIAATLIRASVFVSLGGFSEDRKMSGSEDWPLLCRLPLMGKVGFVNQVVSRYRRHEGNTNGSRYLDSVDRALAQLTPHIAAHWGSKSKWAVRTIRRQALYAQIGALNVGGLVRSAWEKWFLLVRTDIRALGDWRTFRLSMSLTRSLMRNFISKMPGSAGMLTHE